ncbi:MAG: hypothetical protein V9G63_12840 [Candidatus Competibacter sp.]|nr:hypothetical protein [Candidatus Competibacteraceae bacterium]
MQRRDVLPVLMSIGITALLIAGLVYFIDEWWGRLPTAVSLIVFILLSVMVIGYPIYALARWSDRYLARAREAKARGERVD